MSEKKSWERPSLSRRPGVPKTRGFRVMGWRPARSTAERPKKTSQKRRSLKDDPWLPSKVSPSRSCFYQASVSRIINILCDCPVFYALHHFVHNEKRDQEPLAALDRIHKASLYFDIQLCRVKDAMNDVFQLNAVYVVKIISGNDFHIGHQECWI